MALIVKTQLIPPKLKKNILRRDRLLKVLQQNLDKKFILVTAGAGYGKTTLLAQFIRELKDPFVFYAIRKTDINLNIFLIYLITGIKSIYKHFGTRTESVINETIRTNLEMLIGTFVNELLETVDKELFIILDDYHLIDKTEVINRALDYFLEQMPPNIHLIISSRTESPLSIANLRAKGELLELTTHNLRFTIEEMQTLFRKIYRLDIDESLIKGIEHYSEGWVTALQLISYIMEKSPKDALDRLKYGKENFDYFASAVFEQQPKELRDFLLNSSILEQMSPNSCDIVMDRNDSGELLDELTRKNLFISPIDEQRKLFCYHPLFRNFLLNRLYRDIGNRHTCSLHLKAANYFKSVKDYNSSIEHYILASNMHNAVKLIEREGRCLIETQRFDILEQWLRRLPEKIVKQNSTLLWYHGEIFRWQGKWDEAMDIYKKAKTEFIKEERIKESAYVMGGIASIFFYRGAYVKAIRIGEKAVKMVGEKEKLLNARLLNTIGSSYVQLGNSRKAILIISDGLKICKKLHDYQQEKTLMHNLLVCYAELGEYERLIEVSEHIINKGKRNPQYPLGWTYTNLGRAYALKGECERSKDTLQKALQLHQSFNDRRGMNYIVRELGYLNLIMGNYGQARLYYEKAIKLNLDMGEKAVEEHSLRGISMSYLFEGQFVKAQKYIDKIFIREGQGGIYLLTKAEIKLESGNIREAEELLDLAFKHIYKSQAKYELMFAYIALAKLYYKKREENLLAKHLKSALELSKKYGYHFALIRLGRIDPFLLQFAIKKKCEPRYAEFLLKEKELWEQYDLIISLFGGLRIKRSDGKMLEEKWKTEKAKSLFCYLLVNRKRRFSRDKLMELLWPDKSFHKGQSSLHHALSCIRGMIDPFVKKESQFIEYKDGCYGVSPDFKIWLDSEKFEQLISEARKEKVMENKLISLTKYESAIALYQGDFLPELYESWSEERRLFYKGQCISGMEKLTNFYMEKRDFEKVIQYSNKIIALDEFRESAYLLAIRSYITVGNRKSALDLYNKLNKVLKDELNIEPSPEAKELFRKLKE